MRRRTPRRENRSLRNALFIAAVLAIAGGWLFVKLAGPPIPREVTIFTGPPASPFAEDAPRYAEILASHGIEAKLVATDGSFENLERLATGEGARVGFAESSLIRMYQLEQDSTSRAGVAELVSLGALYLEPAWVFAPVELAVDHEHDLDGLLVYPGREGSGTKALAERLLAVNGLDDVRLYEAQDFDTVEEGVEAFVNGEFAAVFLMGEPRGEAVEMLLRRPEFDPVSFRRAEAYERQFPFITAVTLPEGSLDLALNIPDRDLELIAATIQLVTTDDLSPVLVDALLDAASQIHGEETLLSDRGEFPKADPGSLEISPAAERFYVEGPSRWRSILPFWLATWVDRFALGIGTLAAAGVGLGLLITLISRPFVLLLEQLYRRVLKVEKSLGEDPDRAALLEELDSIDADSVGIWVPPMQRAPYMEFRQNIEDVRIRVQRLPGAAKPGAVGGHDDDSRGGPG